MKKKGVVGIIVLIVIIVALLAGAYFLFFRDSRAISGYTYEIPEFNAQEVCDYYNGYEGKICIKATDSVIYYKEGETNDVILFMVTKGLSDHKAILKSSCDSPNKCNSIRKVLISYQASSDMPTFSWYYSDNEFLTIKQWGDSISAANSEVVKHYLDKYPPVQI